MLRAAINHEDLVGLKGIARWLNSQTGIYYPDSKLETLKHKLFKVCLDNRMNLYQLYDQLQNENDKKSTIALQIVAAASTNHTAFFREEIWGWVKEEILPEAFRKDRQVRIWSAAASSGEEAYTIAMVASEILGLYELKKRGAILGTDISFKILKQAEDAVYPKERIRNIPQDLVKKYFIDFKDGNLVKIHDDLRSICLFRRLNLKKRPYPFKKRFHIIFCRNVLYYFTQDEREKIINAIYEVTEPGGWLIVSVTESLNGMNSRWKKVLGRTGIYRKE